MCRQPFLAAAASRRTSAYSSPSTRSSGGRDPAASSSTSARRAARVSPARRSGRPPRRRTRRSPASRTQEPFAASRLREPHGATLAVVEDVRRLELLRRVTRSPEERLGIATAGRATHPLVDGGAVIDSNDEALTAVASGAVVRGTAWLWGTRSQVSSAGVASRQVVEIDQRALPVVGRGRVHGRKPHVAVARVGLPTTRRGL